MIHMKKIFFLLGILILLLPSASAQIGLEVQTQGYCALTPTDYVITVSNTGDEADIFTLTPLGRHREWVLVEKPSMSILPGKSRDIKISVIPPENIGSGTYFLTLGVSPLKDPSLVVEEEICVVVLRNYNAEISKISLERGEFYPGEVIKVNAEVWNTGTKRFDDLILIAAVTNEEGVIEEKRETFSLDSDERENIKFEFSLDKYSPPGSYSIDLTLIGMDVEFDSVDRSFTVKAVKSVEETPSSMWTPIADFNTVTLENEGNVKVKEEWTKEMDNPWNFLFTATGNVVAKRTDKGVLYSWLIELEPGERKSISYQINYWPLIILLILIIYGIYRFVSIIKVPRIRKKVISKRGFFDGGGEFKIALGLKNKTGKPLKNAIVRDFIPPVGRVAEEFETIKPMLRKSENGTELVWRLDNLNPNEERWFTYKLRTLVGAEQLKLPKAYVKAKTDKGDRFKEFSNQLNISF